MSRRITQRKRRARKRRALARRAPPDRRKRRVGVSPEPLDIALGHDGLFRGHPEPVVLVAVYRIAREPILVGRAAIRYQSIEELPGTIRPVAGSALRWETYGEAGDSFALLAVALEEDSGRDIGALYAELAVPGHIVVWPSGDGDALPAHLEELEAEALTPVELKIAGRFPADWFGADDFVAAAAARAPGRRGRRQLRARMRSRDGRNDWWLGLELHIR